jgi:anaerobic selenocysteine-containing dehydrogenase
MPHNPPLQVIGYIATKRGDEDRGPLIRLRADEARLRNVQEGELVWVYGPRRHDLAPVEFDDTIPRGGVVVRDLAGLAPTEIVRLVRVSDDRPILSTIV